MRYNTKTIKKANCNGILIEIEKCWSKKEPEADAYFQVLICDQYDDFGETDTYEAESEAEALEMFDGFVEEYRDKPNWNAQAAYDAVHGTINGQDAAITEMNELWGGEY